MWKYALLGIVVIGAALAMAGGGGVDEEEIEVPKPPNVDTEGASGKAAGKQTWKQRQIALAYLSGLGICKCYPGDIDGDFGPDTTAAIKGFQKFAGIPQTGKWDAATEAAMSDVLAEAARGSIRIPKREETKKQEKQEKKQQQKKSQGDSSDKHPRRDLPSITLALCQREIRKLPKNVFYVGYSGLGELHTTSNLKKDQCVRKTDRMSSWGTWPKPPMLGFPVRWVEIDAFAYDSDYDLAALTNFYSELARQYPDIGFSVTGFLFRPWNVGVHPDFNVELRGLGNPNTIDPRKSNAEWKLQKKKLTAGQLKKVIADNAKWLRFS